MKCPLCNLEGVMECAEEVDIGVGIQRHVYGWDCVNCGQIGICYKCGVPNGIPHAKWCSDLNPPQITDLP